VGSENLKALEAIKALGHQVDLAGQADLEPIRKRLEQIALMYADDPEVQRAAEETKRLLSIRTSHLLRSSATTRLDTSPMGPSTGPPTIQTAPPTIPQGVVSAPPVPPRTAPPIEWKRALWTGVAVGIGLSLLVIVVLVNVARKRNVVVTDQAAGIAVQIATTPPGASIRVNGDAKCTSDCTLTLPPGAYQITAFLDGYEPAASGVNLVLGRPETLNLTMEARPQTIRILSDLARGKVVLDGQPPADLQDGQYTFEQVPPGSHTVSVTGSNEQASFNFDLAPAGLPAVSGPVNTRNMLAMLVASLAGRGRLVTSSGPWKLAVNGQPEDDAGPTGVDMKNFQSGLDEMTVSQGSDQHAFKEDFGPGPILTVFLKTDRNVGTLIVSASENNARVFLNNKEYSRRTQNGQLRIQTIGSVEVRVQKAGFENSPAQTAVVKKGSEVRLEFSMKPMPQFATLRIQGAAPGTEVRIDLRGVGTVASDGSFQADSVMPGVHVVGLRRDQFAPKQFSRNFTAGQTVTIGGSDVVLVAERAPAPPPPPPPPAPKPEPVAPKPAPVRVTSMEGFESQEGWMKQENGIWRHKGGGFLTYKFPSDGLFTFAVYLVKGGNLFRGGRVRWVTDYTDAKNYVLSELDDNNLTIRDVVDGKSSEHAKVKHNVDSNKAWAIQIDISPDRLIHRIQKDRQWVTLDTWTDAEHKFTNGKFGFDVQGNDEIGVSDFKFTPAR
jgi:PEGA domain